MYAMRIASIEKAELAGYQFLKDVAQTWYTQLKNNRDIREGPYVGRY